MGRVLLTIVGVVVTICLVVVNLIGERVSSSFKGLVRTEVKLCSLLGLGVVRGTNMTNGVVRLVTLYVVRFLNWVERRVGGVVLVDFNQSGN